MREFPYCHHDDHVQIVFTVLGLLVRLGISCYLWYDVTILHVSLDAFDFFFVIFWGCWC